MVKMPRPIIANMPTSPMSEKNSSPRQLPVISPNAAPIISGSTQAEHIAVPSAVLCSWLSLSWMYCAASSSVSCGQRDAVNPSSARSKS